MRETPVKKHFLNLAMMTFGSVVVSAAVCMFYSPNNLLSGGIWGLAMLSNHLWPAVATGIFIFLYNVPLMIWGAYELELRFVVYSIYTIIIQSSLMLFMPDIMPQYSSDPLLACIFGGVLVGFGAGWIIRYHGSGGGLDIVGLILKKKIDVSVGNVILAFNAVIVSCAAFIFGFEEAMYTMVSLFITSVVFNKVIQGSKPKRSVMIITEKGPEISEIIMQKMGRGVTIWKAEGAYSHHAKDVLICVISRYEVPRIKELIQNADAQAFVSISEATEIMGSFKNISMRQSMINHDKQAKELK